MTMSVLKDLIFHLSEVLLVPCLVLLALFFAAMLVMLGAFAREALDRRRSAARWRAFVDGGLGPASVTSVPGPRGRFASMLGAPARDELVFEKHLQDAEGDMTRAVERASLLSKLGPMLGLMGTLIPLGPALRSLSGGSVAALSENLVVAFATAVVGLAVAGPCFWMASVLRRWYERDLADMEFVWRRTTGSPAGAGASS
jgi:biopolymer transport protein ExbB/TolQ